MYHYIRFDRWSYECSQVSIVCDRKRSFDRLKLFLEWKQRSISNFPSYSLGDSTFILVRDNKVEFAMKAGTHFFNAPRQLSKLPPPGSGTGNFADGPKDADLVTLPLQNGDILIMASK